MKFSFIRLIKERSPVRQVLFAHWPCLVRCLCKAVLDALSLRFWVNGQVDDLAVRSSLPGEPSQRGPFVSAPKSEIQDDIGMKLKSAQSYPDQTTFQGISFCLLVSSK